MQNKGIRNMKKNDENEDRKLENQISKALEHLHLLTSIYVGKRQIQRGDSRPIEDVWKEIKEKFKFKLSLKNKKIILHDIGTKFPALNNLFHKEVLDLICKYLENRDELFKQKHPKKYPPRYYV